MVAYVGLLDKWNKAYNLTSVRDPNEMLVRHIPITRKISWWLTSDCSISGTKPIT
ncbi:hypothetical protein CP989_25930 [Enterobacter hormaechei]|nr:hypothetical protein CP989_25930 [Enterobacter hormaechei]